MLKCPEAKRYVLFFKRCNIIENTSSTSFIEFLRMMFWGNCIFNFISFYKREKINVFVGFEDKSRLTCLFTVELYIFLKNAALIYDYDSVKIKTEIPFFLP